MDELAKARIGGGARGMKGAPVPRKAPIHTGPKPMSPAWHAQRRAGMAVQAAAHRERHAQQAAAHMPAVRHGGFTCKACGSHDWREHPAVGREGHVHATLAFQGCARCGTMHASHVGVGKVLGEPVDVGKDVDTSETALHAQDLEGGDVGHRTGCPRGGSGPCGREVDGRCSRCNASVQDHQALGKTRGTLLDLRKLAGLS